MTLATNFKRLTQEIIDSDSVAAPIKLIAVSKKQTPQAIEALYHLGQRAFGESYLQEALSKIAELHHLDAEWHFIGRIQSNKAKTIGQTFDWVQSVCKLEIAQRLSQSRQSSHVSPLNVLVQVNIDQDPNKDGIYADQLYALCTDIQRLPQLRLRGLMTILHQYQQSTDGFVQMAALYQQYQATFGWDTLSMGMSNDYRQAIAAGATTIRIGSAIFGERKDT